VDPSNIVARSFQNLAASLNFLPECADMHRFRPAYIDRCGFDGDNLHPGFFNQPGYGLDAVGIDVLVDADQALSAFEPSVCVGKGHAFPVLSLLIEFTCHFLFESLMLHMGRKEVAERCKVNELDTAAKMILDKLRFALQFASPTHGFVALKTSIFRFLHIFRHRKLEPSSLCA
jgi:hypothetical protein